MHPDTPASPWQPVKTVAVVLAGGTGERLGLGIPKQLLRVAGKPILEHTLTRLESAPEIDEIVVLMAAGHVPAAQRIVSDAGLRKVTQVVEGGQTRSATTRLALDLIGDQPCNVLIHDAVRPLLSNRIIRECVNALRHYAAIDVAIASADTIIEVDADNCIRAIPPRAALRRGQTPQAFRSPVIREAYRLAAADPDFAATDDCGVVLRYLPEVAIKVVDGSEENIKITHALDVHLADKLFQLSTHPAPPRDSPRLAEEFRGRTVVVFGGSYGIGQEVAAAARDLGAEVFAFSRGDTGTHVERPADVAAALRTAHDKTGRIDYVVVTAGILRPGLLAAASPDDIDASVQVNFLAPVAIAQAAFHYLAANRGHLVLYTSSSYTRGRAGYALYSATKAAVVNLTQALSDEWAAAGVRVNCINPERTATPMRSRAFGDEPVDSLLQPEIVAATTIDVLVSDLTGHVIDVRRPE
jgi:2-C-methyl-D-erythritol 4-phosphate cytidylyltransferase